MYRLAHEEKNYGFTPNLDFNPLPTRFNLTEFLHTSMHSVVSQARLSHVRVWPARLCIQIVCSTSREKRTSKHGISIVLKLVSIEYQKRDAFLAAV